MRIPHSVAVMVAVVFVGTTSAFTMPSSSVATSTTLSSTTALNQLGTSSSGDWWNQPSSSTGMGYRGDIRRRRSTPGVREMGANEIGIGDSSMGGMVRASQRSPGRRRGGTALREVGPNSIGAGTLNGGRGNIRPYQSGAVERRRRRSGFDGGERRGDYFPRPGRYDSPIRRDDMRRGPSNMNGPSTTIQGDGSRKTFSSYGNDPMVVDLHSDSGRPIDTEVELWQGPDNTSHKMRFYSQNGSTRPFQAVVDTSGGGSYGNTMQVRNTGPMAFPMRGGVGLDQGYGSRRYNSGYGSSYNSNGYGYGSSTAFDTSYMQASDFIRVQGGSLRTMTVDGDVDRIRVDLETDGLPLMATIELWQGPGEAMQVAQIYNDCGRPFSTMVETPGGYGSTIAIRNEGPLEFPIQASIAY